MEKKILIVSEEYFYNHALVYAIHNKLNMHCSNMSPQEVYNSVILDNKSNTDVENKEKTILLWDFNNNETDDLWQMIEIVNENKMHDDLYVVIYNISDNTQLENKFVKKKVRGVIYEHCSFDHFIRAIEKILSDEVWFRRSVLSSYILGNSKKHNDSKNNNVNILTSREKDILLQVYIGKSNQEIADELFICTSTVKSHLHKIFRKIGVPNRIQAALWAAKNLLNRS